MQGSFFHKTNAVALARCLYVLFALQIVLRAQDDVPPAPAQTEMQKWIAKTDEGWQASYKREVTDVHEAEVNKLKLQYLNLLNDAIAKASKASDLDGAVALRTEQKRFSDTEFFPDADEAGDAALVKQARATLRALLAQTEKGRALRAKALFAKYDLVLADAQTQLTKAQRLEDALLVKAKREEVAAAWSTPAVAAAAEQTTATPPPRAPPIPPSVAQNAGVTERVNDKEGVIGKWMFKIEGQAASERELKADGTVIRADGVSGTW